MESNRLILINKEQFEQLMVNNYESVMLYAPLVGPQPVVLMEVDECEIEMHSQSIVLKMSNNSGGMVGLRLTGQNIVGGIIQVANQISSQSEMGTYARD